MAFANAFVKIYYNLRYKPISLAKGSKVYLRLSDSYKIPSIASNYKF